MKLGPRRRLCGHTTVPGDKSISHRALLFGGLAEGTTEVEGLSDGADVRSTARCLRALGVSIGQTEGRVVVHGNGIESWTAPAEPLDCGNSGTTMRLLLGCLAGRPFEATLTGDDSLRSRPMERVAKPLRAMGAVIVSTEGKAPVRIGGGRLRGIDYSLEVPSAQLKTALLLAGLQAEGVTRLTGELAGRDHTERLFPAFGVELVVRDGAIKITGPQRMKGTRLTVPGDPSSAAFFLAAAVLVPDGRVQIDDVLLNPTRIGFVRILERMGGRVSSSVRTPFPEPVGTIVAATSALRGVSVAPSEVPSCIDELPLLAVLATQAEGVTEVRGAAELRVKECDRIEAIGEGLTRMGARFTSLPDGFRVEGPTKLRGAAVRSFADHRIAMSMAIASLVAEGETEIDDAAAVAVSFPGFFQKLEELT